MLSDIESLINSGRYFEAHNLAKEYCADHPDDLRAKQMCGLAMSKSGARNAAINFLEPVLEQNSRDPETAGILGGVYKEEFKMTTDSTFARKSLETYLRNFEETRNYYTGINAATMSQILGRGKTAKELATDVIEIASKDQDFWAYATLGEAYLLIRNSAKAMEYYYKAAKMGGSHYGNMGSVYAQLLILEHYINVPVDLLKMFAPPKVAVFAGHMVDHNREIPRFPEEIVEPVKFAISNELRINKIRIGYSSLACGSDILFVEALLELGGEANIFIPFKRDDFLKTSIEFAGEKWIERFLKIEKSQKINYISHKSYDNNNVLFEFLGKVMIGSGVIRSSLFHDQPFLLTVASERDKSRRPGGTNALRTMWPYPKNLININPDLYVAHDNIMDLEMPFLQDDDEEVELEVTEKVIRYFILATPAVNNSVETPEYEAVKAKVKTEFIEFPGQKRSGISEEGIYAVYTKAHHAMDFALRLLTWSREANFETRIALEAVLMKIDSDPHAVITTTSSLKSLAFSDACYASMQFASALSAEQPGRYDFHHVGLIATGEIDEGQEIYKIDQKVKTALS